jgi:hydrogenase/urease accessory protein HupE
MSRSGSVTCLLLLVLAAVAVSPAADAHRLTPAYLGFTETTPDTFAVQWKVSSTGGLTAVLVPAIPPRVRTHRAGAYPGKRGSANAERRGVCSEGLRGLTLGVQGLSSTHTDVLLRVQFADGSTFVHRLTPDAPEVEVPTQAGRVGVMVTYLVLGVEHILIGVDHLLFVLALLLLVRGVWQLVATVTAFTIAHSITLGAAALGWVHVPEDPVEAVIALSILFLALELARHGVRPEASRSLAARFPWFVAFAFGLLHGFGFAGALFEVGLPEHEIPLALLFFNIGVEIGQLMFIAAVLAVIWLVRAAAGFRCRRGLRGLSCTASVPWPPSGCWTAHCRDLTPAGRHARFAAFTLPGVNEHARPSEAKKTAADTSGCSAATRD